MQYMSRGTKSIAFYLVMIVVFGSLMYFIAKEGESQQLESAITSAYDAPKDLGEGFTVFWELMTHHIQSPIGILLLQIITILLTCRLFVVVPEDRAAYGDRRDRGRYRARAFGIGASVTRSFGVPLPY